MDEQTKEVTETKPDQKPDQIPKKKFPWLNIVLFLATVWSTFYAGRAWQIPGQETPDPAWYSGWIFAVPLMLILLFHEFGHFIAARLHRVPASLPFFIPIPMVFGTMGAIIRMKGRIEKRNALLDIGAAGPLGGMLVAIPVLIIGLSLSEVQPQQPGSYLLEGHSLLYKLLLLITHGWIPAGHDIFLHPVALAGWVGLFVTMLNLIPVGQLDGGHIAFALLGERQNQVSKWALRSLPILGIIVCSYYGIKAFFNGISGYDLLGEFLVGLNWFVWFVVLKIMFRFAGANHPPVDPGPLSPGRKIVGALCLLLFVFIFMPVPLRTLVIPE